MLPYASTVAGWQVVHVCSVIAGVWLASAGGMPWQLPQNTVPVEVQRGEVPPWHHVPQVWASRSHATLTVAGPGTRWPGLVTDDGTAWQVSHGTGPRRKLDVR